MKGPPSVIFAVLRRKEKQHDLPREIAPLQKVRRSLQGMIGLGRLHVLAVVMGRYYAHERMKAHLLNRNWTCCQGNVAGPAHCTSIQKMPPFFTPAFYTHASQRHKPRTVSRCTTPEQPRCHTRQADLTTARG